MYVHFRSRRTCRCHRRAQGQRRRAVSRAASAVGHSGPSSLEARSKLDWRDPTAQKVSAIVPRRTRAVGASLTFPALSRPKNEVMAAGVGVEQWAESGERRCRGGGCGAEGAFYAGTWGRCWCWDGRSVGGGPKRRRLFAIMEKDGATACGRARYRRLLGPWLRRRPGARDIPSERVAVLFSS